MSLPSQTAQPALPADLPPEFAGIAAICTATEVSIGGRTVLGVADARTLHKGLGVGRDFPTWIDGRITKYGFQEGVDYQVFDSPNRGNQTGRGGDRRSQEYRLTLDMAKELAMVENNETGRTVRRYFIWMENKAHATAPVSVAELEAQVLRAMGGVMKGVTNKAIETHLAPINQALAALAARVDQATASYDPSAGFTTDYAPMCAFINPLVPNARKRAVLVRSASRRCTRWLIARSLGSKIKISRESSRHLFHVDAAAEWMEAEGKILIRDHNDQIAGQTVMQFPRKPKTQLKPPTDGGLL